MTRTATKYLSFLALCATTLTSSAAFAHISLERGGGPYLSRNGDTQDDLKLPPCGHDNDSRGTHIYTFRPGETVDFTIQEYIPHPSYFRVAFDQDGQDGFKDPASIKPIDPNRACPDGPGDHCGDSDFYNTPEVLPGMDNLFPHIASIADLQNPPSYTFHVTFPDVECDNCTLQIIQVMEDDAFHGPYDPTPGVGVADVYHQCVDVVLDANAPPTGGADGGVPAGGSGGSGSGGGGNANSAAPTSSDSGGCAVGHGNATRGSAWALVGLALVALRRRRR
ncbi:MAG TPA: SCE4755 family polysaccharide monooxygenase-like protein [Polyangiaceae bacterium]|nr:SCE4755 family polysaccharide monooxygenase-like protein [Polyangiaceae bacterium]